MDKFLNIAHRGAMGDAPENTLAAFKLAIKQGCNAIELDVQLSRDNELFVCHDATVDRTSNGSGALVRMSSNEIKRLDAGSWFHRQFAGERFPLLEEVIDLVPKRIPLLIELKMIPEYEGVIQPILLQLLQRKKRVENVIIVSFDHNSLIHLKQMEPQMKIGLIYSPLQYYPLSYASHFPVPVFALIPGYSPIRELDIIEAIAHNFRVYPWTINVTATMKQLIQIGANGIITNYPARLKAIL